ncbi:unnamed protein product [Onchocerca ochengi]|uniref:Uncharacterized protein n=1 Tax=Onchocerca ochengi TaxID=42157 RepID=A0A182ETJ3_ONCOC|nr:unnamed protein product [Onchocerca ochengi]
MDDSQLAVQQLSEAKAEEPVSHGRERDPTERKPKTPYKSRGETSALAITKKTAANGPKPTANPKKPKKGKRFSTSTTETMNARLTTLSNNIWSIWQESRHVSTA